MVFHNINISKYPHLSSKWHARFPFKMTYTLSFVANFTSFSLARRRFESRGLFALFEAIRSEESPYKFCHCSRLSQLMMLALGNSEKCSRCMQTHTPFTVGSHWKMTVSVRLGTPQAAQTRYKNADVTLACKRCCVKQTARLIWDVNGFS